MDTCLSAAQETGVVHTLMGGVRPITGLTSTRYQDRAAAKRKVVNSIIQVSLRLQGQAAFKLLACELLGVTKVKLAHDADIAESLCQKAAKSNSCGNCTPHAAAVSTDKPWQYPSGPV
eukprot:GHRR01003006.1.p1 GENE.GHRR01003006.1~~GHRR01003006.1.p1  ORF type:complete len:118 (+),score=26.91 GHRR01003006.1:586-939(+)